MDMDTILTQHERIKNSCKVTQCNNIDNCTVVTEKLGCRFWVFVEYEYEYYRRTQTYYEPEEETYTLKDIKDWRVEDLEFIEDVGMSESEWQILKEMFENSTSEDEIIELVLKETNMEY